MFKEFIKEIWKHNERYSLNMFKKQRSAAGNMHGGLEFSSCGRSTISSSNGANERDKRRPWAKSEIELLEKIIESKAVFSQARLQELAE